MAKGGLRFLLSLIGLASLAESANTKAISAFKAGRWRLAPFTSALYDAERVAREEAATLTQDKAAHWLTAEPFVQFREGGFVDSSISWPVLCRDGGIRGHMAMMRFYPPGVRDTEWGHSHDGNVIAITILVQRGQRQWVKPLSALLGVVIEPTRNMHLPTEYRVRDNLALPSDALLFGLEFADGELVPIAEIGRSDERMRVMLDGWATVFVTLRDGARLGREGLQNAVAAIEAPRKARIATEFSARSANENEVRSKREVADLLASYPSPVTVGAHEFRAGKRSVITEDERRYRSNFLPRPYVVGEVLEAAEHVSKVRANTAAEVRAKLEEEWAQTTTIFAASIATCQSEIGQMSEWVDRRAVAFNSVRARYSRGLVTVVKTEQDATVAWSKPMVDLDRIEIFTGRDMQVPPEALIRPDVVIDDAALILCLVFKDGEKIPLSYTVKTPRADLEACKALLEMGWKKQTSKAPSPIDVVPDQAPATAGPATTHKAAPVVTSSEVPPAAVASLARHSIVMGFGGTFAPFTDGDAIAGGNGRERWDEAAGALPAIDDENDGTIHLAWGLPCWSGVMAGFAMVDIVPPGRASELAPDGNAIVVGVVLDDRMRFYVRPLAGWIGFSIVKADQVTVPPTHLIRPDTVVGSGALLFALLFEDGAQVPIGHVVDDDEAETVKALVHWAQRLKRGIEEARNTRAAPTAVMKGVPTKFE